MCDAVESGGIMRARVFVVAVLVAGAVGAASVSIANADGDSPTGLADPAVGDVADLPPGKVDALEGAVPLDASAIGEGGSTDPALRPPLVTSGPAADVAAVQTAAVSLLNAEDALGRVSAALTKRPLSERRAFVTSATQSAQLRADAADAVSKQRMKEVLPAVELGIKQVLTDPRNADLAYSDNAFDLTKSEGAVVSGDVATVEFRGSRTYKHLDGKWWADAESQYVVKLKRDDSAPLGWVLDSWTSVFVDGATAPKVVSE